MDNALLNTIKIFTWDFGLSLIYWPIWWYSKGLKKFALFIIKHIKIGWHNQALGILIKNWFKPMYAQYDLQGRIISLFFRSLMIGWRLIFFITWLVILIILFLLWIIAPLFISGIILFILLS